MRWPVKRAPIRVNAIAPMELFQPAVDALVLALLGRTTFTYGAVVQGRSGQCRLHPPLARAVAAAWNKSG